jgi:hypothetical protein
LWIATCPISGSSLSPACCQPFCLSSLCLLKVQMEISSLSLPPSLVHFQHSCPLCCVLVFSSLFIQAFFFFAGGSVCPRGYAGLSRGCLGEYCVMLGAHLFGMSPKQVCSWHLVTAGALMFPQHNVAWRSFIWVRGSGCLSFGSPSCFISTKCDSSVLAIFLIHGAHAVCFCDLVTILDLISPFDYLLCFYLYVVLFPYPIISWFYPAPLYPLYCFNYYIFIISIDI